MQFRNLAVLCCIGLLAACATKDGAAGNTQIDLTIGTDPGTTSEELGFEADRVDYRITCSGTVPGTLPIPPDSTGGDYDYYDSVDISGSFEIVDGQDPPVWTMVTNLPPGDCTATLLVFRNGEVVCEGSQDFTVVEDGTTMVEISLVCSLSIDVPDGMFDADGDFQFDVGNECPKIFGFSAIPQVVPIGQSTSSIQTLALDLDSTCGSRCDPQTCDLENPPNCMPGPDIGLVPTLSSFVGTFDDPNALLTYYNCDPYFPGPIEICVNLSDGDIDCDKSACTVVVCPDPCKDVMCDDGNECTRDYCDLDPGPTQGQCVFDVAPDGIACDSCNSTCQLGVCDPSVPFTASQVGPTLFFAGTFQNRPNVYVNPYTGFQVTVSPVGNYNTDTYKGTTTADRITGTPLGNYLLLSDPFNVAEQTVCGVEEFRAGSGGDFAHFADLFITTIPMLLLGENGNDVLWGNAGDDFLLGGVGNDLLDGGPGNDIVLGGNARDHITMGPNDGFDSVDGGDIQGPDLLSIKALQSQILLAPSMNPSYEFDVYYLGTLIAEVRQVELLGLLDGSIDLTACVGGICMLCGNDALNGGEECDDGNLTNGDGCASDCTVE